MTTWRKPTSLTACPRRDALQRGGGAIAGIGIIWLAASNAFAASTKLAKAAVQYTDAGNVAGKDCDDCSQFVPGKTAKATGTCKLVDGDIDPHGRLHRLHAEAEDLNPARTGGDAHASSWPPSSDPAP